MASAALVLLALTLVFFSKKTDAPAANSTATQQVAGGIRYLPLGDSYTIGQSVAADQRWPNQLVRKLAADNTTLQIVGNPAVTGYTTQNLIDKELPLVTSLKPDFVTIQIGVNDYIQGVDLASFQKNLNVIIDAVQKGIPRPDKIVLVTIPDYAKTPSGARYGDPTQATGAIVKFNQAIIQTAADHKLLVADIFEISQKVTNEPELVANDGLHPSGKQYGLWTEVIYQTIKQNKLLK